jgi:hypothetical protein
MKIVFIISILFLFTSSTSILLSQDYVDVNVIGMSDGKRESKQNDREEAILNAKILAIEKAGVSIQSFTTVENFMVKKQMVESKAEAYIQPGFQILDMGYSEDKVYKVVLIGKVSSSFIAPTLTSLNIFVNVYRHRPYKLYIDNNICARVGREADYKQERSFIIDNLKQGKHKVSLEFESDIIFGEPRYKFQFSKAIEKEVFLKPGSINSVEFAPHISNYTKEIEKAKKIYVKYDNPRQKGKSTVCNIGFIGLDGTKHDISVKFLCVDEGSFFSSTCFYDIDILYNGHRVNQWKNKEQYARPNVLYENSLFEIKLQDSGYQKVYIIRKDI